MVKCNGVKNKTKFQTLKKGLIIDQKVITNIEKTYCKKFEDNKKILLILKNRTQKSINFSNDQKK